MSAGGQHTWSWESGQRCSSCCLGQWCPALPFLLKELIRDLEVAWGQGRGVDHVSWTFAVQLLYWVHLIWVNYLAVYSEGNILFQKRIKAAGGWGMDGEHQKETKRKKIQEDSNNTWSHYRVFSKAMECILISHQQSFLFGIEFPTLKKWVLILYLLVHRSISWCSVSACCAQGPVLDIRET